MEGHGQAAKEHHHGPRYNAEIENHLQISLQKERKKERERERESCCSLYNLSINGQCSGVLCQLILRFVNYWPVTDEFSISLLTLY